MSFKSRNLAFEKPNEPAFLSRMRAQVSGQADNERSQQAVPRRRGLAPRNETVGDDAPTVVDENGNALSEQDVEALKNGEAPLGTAEGDPRAGNTSEGGDDRSRNAAGGRKEAQEVMEVGNRPVATRKRKAGKAVGLDSDAQDSDDDDGDHAHVSKATVGQDSHADNHKPARSSSTVPATEKRKQKKKKKKKAPAVTLSFGAEDGKED